MPIRNAKTPKHYSAPTTHAPDNSPGRHRTTWVASTFNERRPNGTPRILPKRQPRLRNTLDTRTQHRLDIPRHSRHHINDLPLLGTTPSHHDHRRNHVGISTPTTQTRQQRNQTSQHPPRNRRPTRLGNKKTPKRKPANRAIRRKPVRRPNLVPDQHPTHAKQ